MAAAWHTGGWPTLVERVRLMINGEHVMTMNNLQQRFLPVALDICFCSVFGKGWRTQIESRAKAVSTCSAPTGFLRNFVDLSESNDQ